MHHMVFRGTVPEKSPSMPLNASSFVGFNGPNCAIMSSTILRAAGAVMALSLSRVGSGDGTLSLLAATALSLYSQRQR